MAGKNWTRREFVKKASLGVAGGCAALLGGSALAGRMGGGGGGGMGGGGGGTGGGGTTVIDPPPGAPFADPPDIPAVYSMDPMTGRPVVSVELDARKEWVDVNGTPAHLLTYNGAYPGPLIRARKGDILRIRHGNSLPWDGTNILGHERNIVNLHTHGLHVSPSGNSDNMMVSIPPGAAPFEYEFDLEKMYPGCLNLYHPHIHGSVAEEFWGGLVGPLLIEDEIDTLAGYESHVLVLKDLSLLGSDPAPYTMRMEYMHGKEGDIVTVNGLVNPVLPFAPGQIQRWQILNASNARFYWLGIQGFSLNVVGTDGGLLKTPYPVSRLLLSPGERVDLLVKAGGRGTYKLLSYPHDRGMNALQQVTLMTLPCGGKSRNDPLPAEVDPAAERLVMDTSTLPRKRIELSMMQGRGYINGISFTGMDNTAEFHSMLGDNEVWEVVNLSGMEHPFHQHVNACQVLSVSGGDPEYARLYTTQPAWKDTVIIPKWGSVTLLVPVLDYPGMAMLHCHILEHEDIGMMAAWMIMDPMGGGM